jgi:hypothetical protein
MVNNIINQAASQQMAVAMVESASASINDIIEKDYEKKLDHKSAAKRALESKSAENNSKEILSNLVNKLSASGMKLDPGSLNSRIRGNVKDEYDLMLKSDNDSSDSVSVRSLADAIKAAKRAKNQNRGGKNSDSPMDSAQMKSTVEEYTAATIQFILNGGSELKKHIKRLEAKMKSLGASANDILKLANSVKKHIRAAIAAQLKEGTIKRLLAKSKSMDWIMATKEIYKAFGAGQLNDRIGGWDFGGYNKHLQGTLDKQMAEARGEVRQFVGEEMEKNLVAKHLGNDSVDKDIHELMKLGEKLGFNFKAFSKEWAKKKEHLGFTPVPDNMPNMQAQTQNGSSNGPKDFGGYDYSKDDEKEIFINQLRALFMQRAIKGNFRTILATSFKLKRLKNGLLKLGVKFGDFDKIKTEGFALARLRVMDMLREALYERATLYDLAGPAFKLNAKKIKGLMKNLERLGIELSPKDFEALRDDANRRMFDTAKDELQKVMIMRHANRAPYLEKKESLLTKLLYRLKEESGIATEVMPISEFYEIKEAV